MAVDLHTVSVIDGMPLANIDRVRMGLLSLPYLAGSGAGAASVATFAGSLPPTALILAGNIANAYVDVALTATGFTLTVTPRNSANTLAAGSVGALVIA